MRKTIYSLPALREVLQASNRRYLEFLSAIVDSRNGREKLDKLSQPIEHQDRSYPGFNFFDQTTTPCSTLSPAEGSTSAVCRIKPCAGCWPTKPAFKSPGYSSA